MNDQPIAFPKIKAPKNGDVGDGQSGWGGDKRRKIPELDMAACAAMTIANHWQAISQARIKTRTEVIPLEEEIKMLRKLYAQHAEPPPVRHKRRPKGTHTPARVINRSSVESATTGSEVTTPTSAMLPAPSQRREMSVTIASDDPLMPFFETSDITAKASNSAPDFWRPGKEPTVEDLLRVREDSSDEEGFPAESDEEPWPAADMLGLDGLGNQAGRGIIRDGFTLGPSGLAKLAPQASHTAFVDNRFADSASDASTSPAMSRQRLSTSETPSDAPGSASEAERALTIGSRTDMQLSQSAIRFRRYNMSTVHKRGNLGLRSPSSTHSVGAPSSLHSLGSALSRAMSRSRSRQSESDTESQAFHRVKGPPLKDMPLEDQHIGKLVREREQYTMKRASQDRSAGRPVSDESAAFMLDWVKRQKAIGTIPETITPEYIQSIGIKTSDPKASDLGPWVMRMRREKKWSPVESLLRAGLTPQELPFHYIPHSVSQLHLELYHLDRKFKPEGQVLTKEELDEEIDILFGVGAETADDQILEAHEVSRRASLYAINGDLDDPYDEDGQPKKRRKGAKPKGTPAKRKPRLAEDWMEKLGLTGEDFDESGEIFRDVSLEGLVGS